MKFFDLQVAFFKPLWLRVFVVCICLGWAIIELRNSEMIWAIIFGAMGLFAAWQFFVVFAPKDPDATDESNGKN